MADPQLTMADWLAVAATSGIAGMGGAMAWFAKHKQEMQARMCDIECEMKGFKDMHAEHNVQLAVVESCQENTRLTLAELKDGQKEIHEKLDDVLREVRRA